METSDVLTGRAALSLPTAMLVGLAVASASWPSLALAGALGPAESTVTGAPAAQVKPVEEHMGSTRVIDGYRWMEPPSGPELDAYMHAQTTIADNALAKIPGRAGMTSAITALDAPGASISALTPDGETLYYLKRGPTDDVARLVLRRASGGTEKVLVDPETLADVKPNSEIDQFAPSLDGNYIAYGIEYAGPDTSTLRIYDAVRNTTLAERIEGARFAQVTWRPDGTGFYYTRAVATDAVAPTDAAQHPQPAAPIRLDRHSWGHLGVFMHILGTDPARDAPILDGTKLPFAFNGTNAIPRLLIPPASDYALAIVSDGVSPNLAVATVPVSQLRQLPAPWQVVAAQGDGVTQIVASGPIAFLLTSADAPRLRVATVDLADPGFSHSRTVVPQTDGVITGIAAASDALYLARREGASMHLLRLDYNENAPKEVKLPYAGTIAPVYGVGTAREWGGLVADPRSSGAMFSLESWAHPLTWMRFDMHLRRAMDMALLPDQKLDASLYKTIETTAKADDGTLIPLSIIMRQGITLDHARPALVDAYGSFGYAFDPRFLPLALAWADAGGVFAVAHVRGGGELGEAWHQAGTLARKINAATDMLACAKTLIQLGYTDSAHLAGMGTNAGALAIGNAITIEPSAFRAALINAGLNNPLRAEDTPGHDIDILELGTVHIPLQQAAVLSVDPYARIKDGVEYPAVLLTGSTTDSYEPIWQTTKMAARLQAATTSGRPVLLHVAFDRGRDGPTRAQRDIEQADELSFLLWQLGAPEFQPGADRGIATKKLHHARRRRGDTDDG
jgi:prolyl oligopeptidase